MSDEPTKHSYLVESEDRHGKYWAVYRGDEMLAYCDNNSRARSIVDALNTPTPPAPDAAGLVAAAIEMRFMLGRAYSTTRGHAACEAFDAALSAYRAAAQPDAGNRPTGEVDRLLELARGYGHEGHGSAALDCVIAAVAALAQERHS